MPTAEALCGLGVGGFRQDLVLVSGQQEGCVESECHRRAVS